jgi:hypothetical protein
MKMKKVVICVLICFVHPGSIFSQDRFSDDQKEERVSPNPSFKKDSTLILRKEKFILPQSSPVLVGCVYGQKVAKEMYLNPIFKLTLTPGSAQVLERVVKNTDWMFYLFCGLLLFLSFIRLVFIKYFSDLFRVFFNTSLRQRQIRDQLQQSPLPSLLFNIFFSLSAGVFIYFLLTYYNLGTSYNKWLMMGGCIAGISLLYFAKSLILRLLGWVFGREKAVDSYLFIVFLVNKILGLFLLPFSIMLAFSPAGLQNIVVTFGYIGLVVMFIYRWVRAYNSVRNELRINQLSYIIYIGAFEIIPALLIYRLLMQNI